MADDEFLVTPKPELMSARLARKGVSNGKGKSPTTPTPPAREAIAIGRSRVNASDLKGLRLAWQRKQLVLFLGAGVSLAYGIPTWKNLLLEMLFAQTEHAGRMKHFFPHYRRALASWLADYFEYNPVILARMIEDDIRERGRKSGLPQSPDPFLVHLREHLYSSYQPDSRPTTLTAIANFIAKSNGGIPAVVSFNFDDLLEQELSTRGVDHLIVTTGARRGHDRLPIIHPHGFIPRTGDLLASDVVFTERHYHALTETAFHWALTEIVNYLRHHTVLFIGLSMSDPSLRRLLDACRNTDIPPHWQIQKRHEIHDRERFEVAQAIERSAADWAKKLGRTGNIKDAHQLLDVIDATLLQADTYDRQLFKKLGVKTIWIEEFDDISALLGEISKPEPGVRRRP